MAPSVPPPPPASTTRTVVVILGGWLGCQPRHLRPYEKLYESLGCDVLSFVPSPLCVIGATLGDHRQHRHHHPLPASSTTTTTTTDAAKREAGGGKDDSSAPTTDAATPPVGSSSFPRQARAINPMTMSDLAWKILGEVHDRRVDGFLYHSFSNGGGFLWESLSQIMLQSSDDDENVDDNDPPLPAATVRGLRYRCRGVVFDSGPAWFGPTNPHGSGSSSSSTTTSSSHGGAAILEKALEHCSRADRQRVRGVYGDRLRITDLAQRNRAYFEFLEGSPLDLPQLYLCGTDDELAPHPNIAALIETRKRFQTNPVVVCAWERSRHCGHLRDHPDEYRTAVTAFLRTTTIGGASKL